MAVQMTARESQPAAHLARRLCQQPALAVGEAQARVELQTSARLRTCLPQLTAPVSALLRAHNACAPRHRHGDETD